MVTVLFTTLLSVLAIPQTPPQAACNDTRTAVEFLDRRALEVVLAKARPQPGSLEFWAAPIPDSRNQIPVIRNLMASVRRLHGVEDLWGSVRLLWFDHPELRRALQETIPFYAALPSPAQASAFGLPSRYRERVDWLLLALDQQGFLEESCGFSGAVTASGGALLRRVRMVEEGDTGRLGLLATEHWSDGWHYLHGVEGNEFHHFLEGEKARERRSQDCPFLPWLAIWLQNPGWLAWAEGVEYREVLPPPGPGLGMLEANAAGWAPGARRVRWLVDTARQAVLQVQFLDAAGQILRGIDFSRFHYLGGQRPFLIQDTFYRTDGSPWCRLEIAFAAAQELQGPLEPLELGPTSPEMDLWIGQGD